LSCTELRWLGLGEGRGYLAEGELVISATGRGAAARYQERTVVLPCAAGPNPANPNSTAPTWTGSTAAEDSTVAEAWTPLEPSIAAVG
jgi:hypothetical protein